MFLCYAYVNIFILLNSLTHNTIVKRAISLIFHIEIRQMKYQFILLLLVNHHRYFNTITLSTFKGSLIAAASFSQTSITYFCRPLISYNGK